MHFFHEIEKHFFTNLTGQDMLGQLYKKTTNIDHFYWKNLTFPWCLICISISWFRSSDPPPVMTSKVNFDLLWPWVPIVYLFPYQLPLSGSFSSVPQQVLVAGAVERQGTFADQPLHHSNKVQFGINLSLDRSSIGSFKL